MSGESPVSVLFSSDGYELSAINGNSIPSNTRGLLVEGSDGTNSRFISVDTSGRVVLVGAGTAGTAVGGVLSVQGVSGGVAMPASQSGTWTVQPGNTANTTPWLTTINQGGNSATVTAGNALKVDGSAVTQPVSIASSVTVAQATAANLNATIVGVGTAGTPSGGVLTIQGSASGTPIPISGSITATNASVSSTGATPPTSASLAGGSVTTAAPTYTTGQMNALSLNTSGGLRVDGSGVTQPVSIASSVTVAQPTAANLNATVVQTTAANLNATIVGTTAAGSGASSGLITVQGNASGTPIPTINTLADSTSTGSLGSLNAAVTIAVTGQNNAAMQLVAGTLIGTIVAEVSVDGGTTWTSTFFDDPATSNITSSITFGSSNTATTRTIVAVGGASNVRVRVSAYTSGTATANLRASFMQDASFLSGGAAGSVLPPVINQAGASVTTSAPSYTTGTLNALSLNTSGGLRVDGSGVTQPVSGTVAATQSGVWTNTVTQATAANLNATVVGSGNFTVVQPTASSLNATVVGTGTGGAVSVAQATAANLNATVVGTTAAGSGASSGLVTVQGNASGTPIPVSGTFTTDKSSTSALTSVASNTSSVTLLASNANRVSATFFNDSPSEILYIALTSSAASLTAYSIKLMPLSYWELPITYTGQINGIWNNAAGGAVRITELTP